MYVRMVENFGNMYMCEFHPVSKFKCIQGTPFVTHALHSLIVLGSFGVTMVNEVLGIASSARELCF